MGLVCIMCRGEDRKVGTIAVQASGDSGGSRTNGREFICEAHRDQAWASLEAWKEENPGEPLRGEPGEPSSFYHFSGTDRFWTIYL